MEARRGPRGTLTHTSRWKRVLLQCAVAFAAQAALFSLPRCAWFLSVFGLVAIAGLVIKAVASQPNQVYIEDIIWTLAIFLVIGFLSFAFDNVLWTYTNKHGGPALPASVLAMINLDWKTQDIGSGR